METNRTLRPLPINCGSKVGESLVNSIDGRPDACLGGSTSAEGINSAMIVEDVSTKTQARVVKVLADLTRFDREEVTESVTEQSRLQELIIENDLLKHLFEAKMEYPSRNKSQIRFSGSSDGKGSSSAAGNGGNGQARPSWREKLVARDVPRVNSQGAAFDQVEVRDCVQGELVRNEDAGYKGVQSPAQNHHLSLDGQSEQWQIVKSKGKEKVIEEQPLRPEWNACDPFVYEVCVEGVVLWLRQWCNGSSSIFAACFVLSHATGFVLCGCCLFVAGGCSACWGCLVFCITMGASLQGQCVAGFCLALLLLGLAGAWSS
ncbi:unnamed protein product [Ilex paraguariensis]|uniref:Uncharacterized protein n=1 Tax=Ilex paraguariensis TaxID=185542 RepID=A0ABC8S447_9AQUA